MPNASTFTIDLNTTGAVSDAPKPIVGLLPSSFRISNSRSMSASSVQSPASPSVLVSAPAPPETVQSGVPPAGRRKPSLPAPRSIVPASVPPGATVTFYASSPKVSAVPAVPSVCRAPVRRCWRKRDHATSPSADSISAALEPVTVPTTRPPSARLRPVPANAIDWKFWSSVRPRVPLCCEAR